MSKRVKSRMKPIGINLKQVTRVQLELVAAGMDRTIGWLVREAVEEFLDDEEAFGRIAEYAVKYPKLAAQLAEAEALVTDDDVSGAASDTVEATDDTKEAGSDS